MATITINQQSYSNVAAILNVSATATRTGSSTVSITANWSILTASSSLDSATRYLVLFIDSTNGSKYYSTAIRSGAWNSQTTYSGSYTFTNIPLSATATSIKIGFGVSASNSSVSSDGTLIWNGSSPYSGGSYSPTIQFSTITGIAQGYTACTAPTTFTASPDVFGVSGITLTWSGATGGTNNAITGYEMGYRHNQGGSWNVWVYRGVYETSPSISVPGSDTPAGTLMQYRIRTLGEAGSDYYSEWKESNVINKNTPPNTPTDPHLSNLKVSAGDKITLSWAESTDIDNNQSGYRLARTPINGEVADVGKYVTISMGATNNRDVIVSGNPGDTITYVVRAEDELGDVSDWLTIGDVTVFCSMKIFNGESWDMYIPYIFEDGESYAYVPYTYDGSKLV